MEDNKFCGEGVFGRVEKVPVNYDGRRYVTKKLSLNRLKLNDKNLTLPTILKEIRILAKLDHKYIVRYYFYGFEGPNKDKYEKDENTLIEIGYPTSDGNFSGPEDFFFIRMEYCDSDLEKLLLQKNSHEERNKFKRKFYSMLEQIMTALEYFHKERVIHRDIKPANILLKRIKQDEEEADDWMVKICDFGLACEEVQGVNTKSCRGTQLYQAPEMRSRSYNSKVDIYSAGLTFLEMLCYFKDKREREVVFGSIFLSKDEDKFDGEAKLGLDILDIQLIKEMTKKDAEKRADAKRVLELIERNEIPTESTVSDDWIKLEGQLSIESSVTEDKRDSTSQISPVAEFAALVVNRGVELHTPSIFFDTLEPSKKFSGRKHEREKLREMFNTVCIPQCNPVHNLILISGLSGVGKSELVRQFIKELKCEKLASCVWLQGETHVALHDSILRLAKVSKIEVTDPGTNKPKTAITILPEIIESTRSSNQPWVFVIDNLDRKEELEKLARQVIEKLQNPPNIFVIVTSQLPGAIEGEGYHLELCVWNDMEACAFVTEHLENAGKQEDIQKLCETLQNLPLILNLAINSIEKKRRIGSTKGRSYSVKDYQEEILSEKYDKELPEELDRLSKVWKVIHGDILKEELGSVAIDVIGCLSHLNPDGIHIDILKKLILSASIQSKDEAGSYWMSRFYSRVFSYLSSFRYVEPGAALWPDFKMSLISNLDEHYSSIIPKCLFILRSYSLIQMEDNVVTLHRLVQKVVRLVNPVGPSPLVQPPSYSPLSKLGCGAEVILKEAKFNKDSLRQITLLWDHIKKVDALLINFKCIPSNLSQWMGQLGLVSENLEFLRAASAAMTSHLLPEDKALLLLRRDLGVGYQLAEKMEEAQEIFQELNPLMERVFGETDENTILSNLSYGAILRYNKRETEAFNLYENLLQKAHALAREKQLEDTDLTVKIKQKLAHLYGKKGDLQKELHTLQDILKWKKLNQDDSDKAYISELRTRQNIGCCYMRLKMYKEAKETFEFVYEKRLELFTEDHASTLNTKHDLAEAMLYLGEEKETGLRYLHEVLSLKTKVQGESHRRTKLTRDAIDRWSEIIKSTEAVQN